MGEGGGPARSEGSRDPQDGEREEICPKVCPELTGFFGCALPATFARRAPLLLRMTSDFVESALLPGDGSHLRDLPPFPCDKRASIS